MLVSALIAAAGRGNRMNSLFNKQYLSLLGRPVLAWTLEVFFSSCLFDQVIVIVTPGEEELCRKLVLEQYFKGCSVEIVSGGKERQHSVYEGLKALHPQCDVVCVHDGVRPLVTVPLLRAAVEGAISRGSAISAVAVKDTIKEEAAGVVVSTLLRSCLRAVQTPQVFKRSLLERAHKEAFLSGFIGTDDASLVERLGEDVCFSEGSYENIKITTPEDLIMAEAILKRRQVRQ